MKALYSYRHGKLKHFHETQHVFPVREAGNPIVIEHSHCLIFVYKRRFSHHPVRVLVLWDFPTSVTLKALPSRQT